MAELKTGDLNQRIKIQKATYTKDAYGQDTATWVDHIEVWANAKLGSVREVVQADRITHYRPWKFTIRYRSDIDPTMRVVFRNQTMPIIGMGSPDGRIEFLEINTQDGQPT